MRFFGSGVSVTEWWFFAAAVAGFAAFYLAGSAAWRYAWRSAMRVRSTRDLMSSLSKT
jgi:hypothetical protein